MSGWGYAWAELRRRRGRTLLTLLSVVIAVAAIVAVTSATATTRKAYQKVFETLAGRSDLEVVARGGGRFQQSVAEKLAAVPGVQAVVPVFHRATILYAHGTKAKVLAVGIVPDSPESLDGFHLLEGHLPQAAGEVALEAGLAEALHLKVGESVRLLTARGLRSHKVAGLLSLESAVRLHEGGMLLAPVARLQTIFKTAGEIDAVHLYLDDSHSISDVQAAAANVLPRELRVQVPSSRSGLAEEMLLLTEVSLDLASALSFTTAVVIALSVFLMNVGERRRQISILRALGATRRQVMGMICREALAVGLLSTAIGIPLGIYGGGFLMQSMGAILQASLPERPELGWAAIASGLSGPVICLIAAWYPAWRASRVSPLEGMRPVVTLEPARTHRRATMAGLVGIVVTTVLAVGCVRGVFPIWVAIGGVIIALVALVLLVPVALRPAVALLTIPLRGRESLEAQMSSRLVLRHAGRSALTVGVLLIAVAAGVGTSNAVFSITDDTRTWYERTITADFLLRAAMPDMSGQDATSMDESIGRQIVAMPGVERVEAVRILRVEAGGAEAMLIAREFELYNHVPLDIIGGESPEILRQVQTGQVVLGSVLAEKLKVRAGDTLELIAGDRSHAFTVAAIATEYTFGGAVVYLDRTSARRFFQAEGVDSYLIKVQPGSETQLGARLALLATRHGLLLQSFAELLKLIDATVAGVTGGLWVLLTLGLFVVALGVVNTLTINVLEQTRELGMLRAVGMQRGQVVRTVLGQALLIGLLGVISGGAMGLFLARMINICLGSLFGRYVAFAARPQFIVLLLLAALAVVMVSALVPGRRAAGLRPIQATRQD